MYPGKKFPWKCASLCIRDDRFFNFDNSPQRECHYFRICCENQQKNNTFFYHRQYCTKITTNTKEKQRTIKFAPQLPQMRCANFTYISKTSLVWGPRTLGRLDWAGWLAGLAGWAGWLGWVGWTGLLGCPDAFCIRFVSGIQGKFAQGVSCNLGPRSD